MADAGHAVRITTRSEERRSEIEASGAECWLGTPERLGSLRAALDGVTVACWMLVCATGPAAEVRSLHGSRLELFLRYVIDTTVRGFVYDASPGTVCEQLLEEGAAVTRSLTRQHSIPAWVLVHGDEAPGDDAGEQLQRLRWAQDIAGAKVPGQASQSDIGDTADNHGSGVRKL